MPPFRHAYLGTLNILLAAAGKQILLVRFLLVKVGLAMLLKGSCRSTLLIQNIMPQAFRQVRVKKSSVLSMRSVGLGIRQTYKACNSNNHVTPSHDKRRCNRV